MNSTALTLAANDAEDLEVISARLQDAVCKIGDLKYLPKSRRFAAMFNRFKWESGQRGNLRIRTGVHFDSVLSVKSKNIKMGAPEAIVSLLAIKFTPAGGEDPAGKVELVFAGGGSICLEVECIDAGLADVGGEWAARGRPSHEET